MRAIAAIYSLLLASLTSQAAVVSFTGYNAKRLYLALKDVPEQDLPFYSLKKSSKDVLCREFHFGPKYDLHQECTTQVEGQDPIHTSRVP